MSSKKKVLDNPRRGWLRAFFSCVLANGLFARRFCCFLNAFLCSSADQIFLWIIKNPWARTLIPLSPAPCPLTHYIISCAGPKQAALWDEVKDITRRPRTSLSGGQQQRLCIARALAVGPPILLMDEPTSALDPIATAKIEELIAELKKEVTITIVTHNMQQAARISDKTAFFLMGEMVEFGETSTTLSTVII